MKICPYCAEELQDLAKKCRFCGSWLDESSADISTSVKKSKDVTVLSDNGQQARDLKYGGFGVRLLAGIVDLATSVLIIPIFISIYYYFIEGQTLGYKATGLYLKDASSPGDRPSRYALLKRWLLQGPGMILITFILAILVQVVFWIISTISNNSDTLLSIKQGTNIILSIFGGISYALIFLSLLSVLFSKKSQGYHDKLAKIVVVDSKKRSVFWIVVGFILLASAGKLTELAKHIPNISNRSNNDSITHTSSQRINLADNLYFDIGRSDFTELKNPKTINIEASHIFETKKGGASVVMIIPETLSPSLVEFYSNSNEKVILDAVGTGLRAEMGFNIVSSSIRVIAGRTYYIYDAYKYNDGAKIYYTVALYVDGASATSIYSIGYKDNNATFNDLMEFLLFVS